jgi:hypothetical protein
MTGCSRLTHLADAGADLGPLPGALTVTTDANRGGRGVTDGFRELVLPGHTGPELFDIEPGTEPPAAQSLRDLPDGGLVLAVVAEERRRRRGT